MQFLQNSSQTHELPGKAGLGLLLGVFLAAAALLTLTGCGLSGSAVALPGGDALIGNVRGGNQPVSGSHIQLYATGTSGTGSAAQPLLSNSVESDSNGNFLIPTDFRCPSQSSQIFLVADGGNPGLSSGTDNQALALTAMLGSCSSLSAANIITVDEVTTVGSVWPLAHYMKSPTNLGSAPGDTAFLSAVSTVPEFINLVEGSSPGTPTPTSYFAQNSKLYSLADALSNCVNSSGGSAGDGSPCGLLFSMATPTGGTPPTDTITAAMEIAQNPDNNVTGIFSLVRPNTPFRPTLTSAPPDWSLNLTYAVATPAISLGTGTYTGTQEVTITDSTAGSTIYYTTDGTMPTSSSPSYVGAISIAATSTLQAIAVLEGSESGVASSKITITTAAPPAKLAFLQQPSNALTQATISPAVQVAVEDSNGNTVTTASNPVTLALTSGTGLGGTLTVIPQNGVATFSNLTVSNAGAYTLSASSPSLNSATSKSFTISTAGSTPTLTPVKLAFLQQPSNALTQATITPAVRVAVEDNNGNTVTTATNPVTLALTGATGLGGTLTATPQNGVATFSNLTVSNPGTYTLSASSPSLSVATSTGFTISTAGGTTATPAKLAFLKQPSNALTQATISPAVQVAVEDANGNTVTTATNPVTLALTGATGLGGTLTVTPLNGIATFSNLTVSNAGAYTLSATSPSLSSATSTSFTISTSGGTTATPAKLAFLKQPSNALTQATISPAVQVAVEDSNGNTVTTATNPVTLALTGATGLGGTLTVTPLNGIATFSNLTVSNAGTYTVSATSPALTSASSTSFTITASGGTTLTPAKLAFVQQPSNALPQAAISPAVQVAVEDSTGNTVTTATNPVTLALTSGTGLGGTLTVTAQSGVATFSNLTVSNAGTYTLSATSPTLTSATSTSFTIAASSSSQATYYLSPTGNDSNSGLTSSLPWLTPNHPLNCGDVIIAAASTSYSSSNFRSGNWGTVSCPAGNNVAWLKCAQFDACKITAAGGQPGIYVDMSYWGVEGWEVSATNSTASFCFGAAPNYLTPVNIHHIIFANNIANGCQQGGFTTFNSGTTASVDYVSIVGNIAYNAAQNGANCFSGISIYQPIQSDSLPGTHIYVAGNFSYGNFDANPCAGGIPTDGEGLIFDTFDGDQGGLPSAYAAQAVADNNILVGNGGRGLQVGNNSIGTGPFATIYVRHNTTWGNNSDLNQNTNAICGELSLFRTVNTSAFSNLAVTNQSTGCGNNPIYALYVWGGNATDDVYQNWGYAVSGTTSSGLSNSTGFTFDSDNTFGENPGLANPITPGAPNCSASSSVPACMATTIANFKPTNSAAAGFGYQAPSSTPIYDPLFPQWLCNTNLPAGLVTMGCQTEP